MNAHAQMTERQRLDAIHAAHGEVGTRDWTLVEDAEGGFIEATAEFGERVVLLRFDPVATAAEKMFVADALAETGFLLKLVDRAIAASRAAGASADAIDRMRAPPSSQPPAGPIADERKNYAAEAAMKCGEAAFKVFLEEQHGLERPLTDERTAQKLRSLLGVTSRRDLNDNDEAAARWKKLRGEYEAWRRAQR